MRLTHAALPLALIGAGAGTGFAILASRVKSHDTRYVDGRVRRQFPKRRRRSVRAAANAIGPLGKWWGQMPVAAATAAVVYRNGGPRAAAAISGASAAAASLAWLLERTMTPRKPPPGRHSPTEPAFPSGHALQSSAVALSIAYVLTREGMTAPAVAFPVAAAVSIASGLAKLYTDGHWFTDVMGGYLLGTTLAATAAVGYELGRPKRGPRALGLRRLARAMSR